jgi:hypothetical protein
MAGMDVTDADVTQIPPGNLNVPLDQFVAVWRAAETDSAKNHDWYTAGIALTCRWLANVTIRPNNGPWYMASAPVTKREGFAYEELIEAECLQVETLLTRRPAHVWLHTRPGFVQGVLATFCWAWRRTAGPPLDPARNSAD